MKDVTKVLKSKYVALDISNSDIRVVEVRGDKIEKFASAPVPDGAIKDGMILEPQTITVIIDNVFNSLKLDRKHVICSVTGLPFIYRVIAMPKSGQGIPDEAVERAAKKEMSLSRDDMYLLWEDTKAAKEDESDYFVLGVPKTSLRPLIDTLTGANIKPYLMDVKPLALARALSLKEGIIVSLERSFFDIVVVFDGTVRIMHSVSPTSKPEALTGLVGELIDGLNMAVKSFNRDYPQNTFSAETPIYLTGGLASNTDMVRMVQEATGHPITILKPGSIELPADMPPELYAAAIGLIFKKLTNKIDKSQYNDVDINLLLKTQKPRQLRQQIALGVSIIFILLLAALVYQANSLKNDAIANVEQLQQQNTKSAQLLATAQKAVSDAEASRTAANSKIQSLVNELNVITGEHQKIMDQKYDYAHDVNVIMVSLPEGADFQNMSLLPGNIVMDGQVADPFDILAFNEAMVKGNFFSAARVSELQPIADSVGASYKVIITGKK